MSTTSSDGFIPPHGGYEKLLSYQKALIVFEGTVFFVKKWLPARGDRTVDQMVQAARSGKQNIVEGSIASATSKRAEIELTNWAKASQEELKEDYLDFLRTRQLREWPESHAYSQRLRELNRQPGTTYADFSARHRKRRCRDRRQCPPRPRQSDDLPPQAPDREPGTCLPPRRRHQRAHAQSKAEGAKRTTGEEHAKRRFEGQKGPKRQKGPLTRQPPSF